jgi:NAD(P)-dependent dehydrogenase (short-subunit alcohol dehydrogenase family)
MGKVLLVTGAGRGLGYCITKRYVQKKDTVYALEYQITEELRKLERENDNLHVYQCDVGSEESVKEAVKPILKAEQRLDFVYNVAGIFTYAAGKVGLAETDIEICKQMYNVNALGSLRICGEVWPLIQKGTLVLILSSEAGSIGAARRKAEYAYCMSKAALNMLGKLLSNELWEKEARVIMLHPGWLRTVMGGEEAKTSSNGVEPEASAEDIMGIAEDIDKIPRDQLFMTHRRDILPW